MNQTMDPIPLGSWSCGLCSAASRDTRELVLTTTTDTLFTTQSWWRGQEQGRAQPYFCSRLQTMTMPLASLEASRLSSQLKLTSSTGALWP